MSEQNPPGGSAEGPDPFDELLKGLVEEPAAQQPDEPVTGSADVPTVAFTPITEPPVVPPTLEQAPVTAPPLEDPTVAFAPPASEAPPTLAAAASPEPAASLPGPIPASGTPSAGLTPTVVLPGTLEPTAATTVLGGTGGGLPPSEPPRGGGFRDWDPRRKALFITLIAVAGVLLIALVILLIVLLGGNKTPAPVPSPTGTSTTTPTPTRSATPTPTPTPTVKPAVQSFTVDTGTAGCADTAGGTNVMLNFAWTVVGPATQVAIASGPSAVDAIATPFQNNLPLTETRFPMPFQCSNAQLTYSLTIADAANQHYTAVVTVVRQVTPPPPAPNPSLDTWSASTTSITCPADPTTEPTPTVTLTWSVSNWQSGAYLVFGINAPGDSTRFTDSSGSIISSDGAGSPGDFPEFPCDGTDQTYYLTLFSPGGAQLGQKTVTVTQAP